MAYITAEEVKEKRNELKKVFPRKDGWKFSVTREYSSSINVYIMESPFDLGEYKQVNQYYIDDHYKDQPKIKEVLKKIIEIANKGNFDKSDIMIDFFHVGFYLNVYIGKWDKPHKWNEPEVEEKIDNVESTKKLLSTSLNVIGINQKSLETVIRTIIFDPDNTINWEKVLKVIKEQYPQIK